MPTISESFGQQPSNPVTGSGGIHDALVAGVDVLGQREQVSFIPYIRTVLPLDGQVFWLNANLLTAVQLAAHGLPSAAPVNVTGSLHYSTTAVQVADETIAVKSVDFTSEVEVEAFGALDNDTMYIGTWETPLGPFQFTFSRRNPFYVQAGIHHYVGDAIYPAFVAQLIDSVDQFDQRQVVSNSLPLWLAMIQSPYIFSDLSPPISVLYPAFLVPDNLIPAYGVIDIVPSSTRALQAFAWRDRNSSRWQLTAERVRLTTYGLRNDEVMDLLDYTFDYCRNVGTFGLMSTPIVRDEQRPQIELAALAQKKTIEFEISYSQYSARNIARQFIKNTVVSVTGSDQVLLLPSDPLFPILSPINSSPGQPGLPSSVVLTTETGVVLTTETGVILTS